MWTILARSKRDLTLLKERKDEFTNQGNSHHQDTFNKGTFNKGTFSKGTFSKGALGKGTFNRSPSFYPYPLQNMDIRKLRACMICGYTQPHDEFLSVGCPNCTFLSFSPERILDVTASTFSGLVGIVRDGWVARWMRLESKAKGMYALRVVGRLPEDILDILAARDIKPIVSRN